MKEEKFFVTGMTCAACRLNIIKKVSKLGGVKSVDVNLLSKSMVVTFDESVVSINDIVLAVSAIGYGASPENEDCGDKCNTKVVPLRSKNSENYKTQWNKVKAVENEEIIGLKKRVIFSFIFLIPLLYIAMGPMIGLPNFPFLAGNENALVFVLVQFVLCFIIAIINKMFFVKGIKALINRAPNMDSLVAVGSGASLIYGIVIMFILAYNFGHGNINGSSHLLHSLYFESCATILTLVTLGKFFESMSKQKTSSAIEKLIRLAPKTSHIISGGKEIEVLTEDIKVGDIVVIKSGDTIPVDGVIVDGYGLVNQSAITGESEVVKLSVNQNVISASICENGSFRFKATKVGEDTTLAEIIRLVKEAGSSKAKVERIADKVSSYFVPVVMIISLITFIAWLIAGKDVGFALTLAVSVLVISCPCALGLATPVAIMVATGKSAQLGILTKSAEALERLCKVDTLVLDKTGTITVGKPTVTDIVVLENSLTEKQIMEYLAILEKNSNHPLALAIMQHYKDFEKSNHKIENYFESVGKGIYADIDGIRYYAGNLKLISSNKLITKKEANILEQKLQEYEKQGKTPILLFKEKLPLGMVMVADKIKPDSKDAIASLQALGLKVIMLTGDNKFTANAIANELSITEVISDVMPSEKQEVIKKLQASGNIVAMVGDGINDSPALTLADVGIAVSSGTDIAIESADIVLTNSSLSSIPTAIKLSKATISNIKMNLFWAFFYNTLGIPLAAGVLYPVLGFGLSPMIASLAMSLSSVCVVLNALRLNFFKPKQKSAKIAKNNKNLIKNLANKDNNKNLGDVNMNKTIFIEGMMCAHCEMHVKNALSALSNVKSVEVSLNNKCATILAEAEIDNAVIIDAINNAGYKVTEIK